MVKRLNEHADFEDIVRAAAEQLGMLPALVLKDYWVTRVLRAIAADKTLGGQVLFKGGTSLSKGWNLIDRFSEDIDLLLTGPDFGPPPESKGERERLFKRVRKTIEAQTPLRLPDPTHVSREVWNFYYLRADWHCNMRFPLPGKPIAVTSASADWVLVEAGFRGGTHPHARRVLQSLVGSYLNTQTSIASKLVEYAEDLVSFEMDLLKPERTFAEKVLGLHVDMSDGEDGAKRVRIRHYSDVAELMTRSRDVQVSLENAEFMRLLREAAVVSNQYYGTKIDIDHLDILASPALTPSAAQIKILKAKYENPLEEQLHYRGRKSFDDVMKDMASLRDSIRA